MAELTSKEIRKICASIGFTAAAKPSDYDSLSEFVDVMNKAEQGRYEATNGGGIAGYSTHYSLIKYKHYGKECDGYKVSSGSYIGFNRSVKYFDAQGIEITDNIKEVAGSLYYIANTQEVITHFLPFVIIVVAMAVVLITLIKNTK